MLSEAEGGGGAVTGTGESPAGEPAAGVAKPAAPAPGVVARSQAAKRVLATQVQGTVKWFNVRNGYGFINSTLAMPPRRIRRASRPTEDNLAVAEEMQQHSIRDRIRFFFREQKMCYLLLAIFTFTVSINFGYWCLTSDSMSSKRVLTLLNLAFKNVFEDHRQMNN